MASDVVMSGDGEIKRRGLWWWLCAGLTLVVVVVAGLAIDAFVHLDLASSWTALIALLVSAGGFAAVLVYQYIDVGAIGPLPNMYGPLRYPEKTLSVWAEGSPRPSTGRPA